MRNIVNPPGFYVYLHKKSLCGTTYYVGKGEDGRAWSRSNRNPWWRRLDRKHGREVEIVQDNMSEYDAFTLEMWLIAKFRHEGLILCNLTDGGDGVSGLDHPSKKKIYCSNGMDFPSLDIAVDWVRDCINQKASHGGISICANGKSNSAYGLGWSYEGVPPSPEFSGRDAISKSTIQTHSKEVYCSNGMRFDSSDLAAKWLSDQLARRCLASHISSVCTGKTETAYGYAWSREGIPNHPELSGRAAVRHSISEANKKRSKQVKCSNGMIFNGGNSVEEWLRGMGWPKANFSNVSACALGKVKSAYGYSWSYTN